MDDHDHDHDHQNVAENSSGSGGSGGTLATSRWNPTKEQINMLEGLYRQGIRTPSAEQIQQITSRLRTFGHIEGKNVFYWFQNHKARQRQKQKQESMAYIKSFLHRSNTTTAHTTQPIFAANSLLQYPSPNVVCGPYYVPVQSQGDRIGSFRQQNHLPITTTPPPPTTTTCRRLPRLDKLTDKSRTLSSAASAGYDRAPQAGYTVDGKTKMMISSNTTNKETLALFPLSPTGVLRGKDDDQDQANGESIQSRSVTGGRCSDVYSTCCEVEEGCSSAGGGDKPFYDFFSR